MSFTVWMTKYETKLHLQTNDARSFLLNFSEQFAMTFIKKVLRWFLVDVSSLQVHTAVLE